MSCTRRCHRQLMFRNRPFHHHFILGYTSWKPSVLHLFFSYLNIVFRSNQNSFLVAPIYDWVPLYISQSLCVFLSVPSLLSKRKFQKKYGELNPRCLHELARPYHLSYSGLSIWIIILPNKCSKMALKSKKITQKLP